MVHQPRAPFLNTTHLTCPLLPFLSPFPECQIKEGPPLADSPQVSAVPLLMRAQPALLPQVPTVSTQPKPSLDTRTAARQEDRKVCLSPLTPHFCMFVVGFVIGAGLREEAPLGVCFF